ncbi:MAG: hypothetical protein ABI222_16710 [Opitutaceae bacterium]
MDRQKINRITGGVLVLGLGCALAIYLTAAPVFVDPLLGDPLANKKYLHELQIMGGKGNVLAAEFQDWFAGLWQGRELGGTVAVLTIGVVLVFRFVASHPEAEAMEEAAAEEIPPHREKL